MTTLSELIKTLTDMLNEHGDIPLLIETEDGAATTEFQCVDTFVNSSGLYKRSDSIYAEKAAYIGIY